MPFSPPDSPVGHPEVWDLLLLYSIDKPRCGYSLSIFLLPFETNTLFFFYILAILKSYLQPKELFKWNQ